MADRLPRRGQPRRHDPARGPPRRDARVRRAPSSPPAAAAETHGCVATVGKVGVQPGGVNAIASAVTAWLDARGAGTQAPSAPSSPTSREVAQFGGLVVEESWTRPTPFDPALVPRLATRLGGIPVIGTGAGHDAGILANAGVPTAMLFVRNPTGVSHSPAEFAEPEDCLAGVEALATVLADLAGPAHDDLLGRARLAARRGASRVSARGRRRALRRDRAGVDRRAGGDDRLRGVVLPGLANAHSHAFHRALRGRTHGDGGNFWTWREQMYAVAARLDPDTYFALARAVFAEMALAGYTVVGEFHYLHHVPAAAATTTPTPWGRR